jgi:CDP-glucose 4,6-dehydratase
VAQWSGAVEDLVGPDPALWANKRVLVLGHTGFKGAWLSFWLWRMGAKVFGMSLPSREPHCLYNAAALDPLFDTVDGDIRNYEAVARAVDAINPEIVFHLAAQSLVRQSYRDPISTYATNVMGTVHVLAAAQAAPTVKCVVIVTSDKCYENREWLWAYREDEPLGGSDPYSSSKACAELVTAAWRQSFARRPERAPIGIASVRAGNVIGGGDWAEDRLVPDCMRALMARRPVAIRNPRATRPWQHVLDPLCGYLLLAERLAQAPEVYGESWNFGPLEEDIKPVGWLASRIVELWGDGSRWQAAPGDALHEATFLKVDASKARSRLGWRQRLRLEAGLDWTVEWYRSVSRGGSAREVMDQQLHRFSEIAAAN